MDGLRAGKALGTILQGHQILSRRLHPHHRITSYLVPLSLQAITLEERVQHRNFVGDTFKQEHYVIFHGGTKVA